MSRFQGSDWRCVLITNVRCTIPRLVNGSNVFSDPWTKTARNMLRMSASQGGTFDEPILHMVAGSGFVAVFNIGQGCIRCCAAIMSPSAFDFVPIPRYRSGMDLMLCCYRGSIAMLSG
jgi:hypothetical protein